MEKLTIEWGGFEPREMIDLPRCQVFFHLTSKSENTHSWGKDHCTAGLLLNKTGPTKKIWCLCNESVFFNLIKLPFFCSPAIQSFEKKSALEYLNRRLLHCKRIKDKHIVWKFNCVLVPNNRVRYYQKAFRCRHVIERGGTSATNLWTHNSALLNEI